MDGEKQRVFGRVSLVQKVRLIAEDVTTGLERVVGEEKSSEERVFIVECV